MNKYSQRSRSQIKTSHKDLITIFTEVLKDFDHSVIEGHRSVERQQELFADKKTQIDGVNKFSEHNKWPSMAVDVAPYPIDWEDRDRFHYFAGFVKATAIQLYEEGMVDYLIRWGGDWDGDYKVQDNNFDDLVHFELIEA